MKRKPEVKNVDDASPEIGLLEKQVNQIHTMIQQHGMYDKNFDTGSDDIDGNWVAVISVSDSLRK